MRLGLVNNRTYSVFDDVERVENGKESRLPKHQEDNGFDAARISGHNKIYPR